MELRKWIWSYIDGISVKLKDKNAEVKYAKKLKIYDLSNSKILIWINNFVSQSTGMQLAKYDTAKEVWDHLKCLYAQSNFEKWYQLKSDIRALKHNNMTVQEFYSAMSNLWDQLALMESTELKVVKAYIDQREEKRLVQFLMVHRNPPPSVDSIFNELLT